MGTESLFVDARERERFFDSKMENQPNEILEHIFKQFNDFGVIKKFSKTCVKWQQITDKKFSKGFGKILVVSKSKIEITDLFNAKNKHEFVDQTFSCISSRLF